MFQVPKSYRVVGAEFRRHILKSNFHSSATVRQGKVAVVLSGCGVYDGTEIHEAAAILMHLSRARAGVKIFAPAVNAGIVNHLTGEPVTGQTRNALEEAARIARGQIKPLEELSAEFCDAVIIPGGFGVAKVLSTFGADGVNMKVDAQVERVLKEFHEAGKPIGLCCIAPVLAAKVIRGCEVTVGQESEGGGRWPHAATAGAIKQMGATHVKTEVTDIHLDRRNKIVTTAAFMCDTALYEIYEGIGAMIEKVIMLVGDGHK